MGMHVNVSKPIGVDDNLLRDKTGLIMGIRTVNNSKLPYIIAYNFQVFLGSGKETLTRASPAASLAVNCQ